MYQYGQVPFNMILDLSKIPFLNHLIKTLNISNILQKLEHYIYLSAKLKMCFKVMLAKRINTSYQTDKFNPMQNFQD